MNKRSFPKLKKPNFDFSFSLWVLAAGFFFGCLLGVFFSDFLPQGEQIPNYVYEVISGLADKSFFEGSYFDRVLFLLKYHLVAFALGFSILGVVLVPALLFLRGMLLSFCAAVFTRVLGYSGLSVVVYFFAVPALISVPCLFVMAYLAHKASIRLAKGEFLREPKCAARIYGVRYFKINAVVLALQLVLSLLYFRISSGLISNAATALLSL